MNTQQPYSISAGRFAFASLLTGFLLNLTGWVGNNFLLGGLWDEVVSTVPPSAWQSSIWREVFSLAPDFLFGFAIVWLCIRLRVIYPSTLAAALRAGLFVSLTGGVTTYFAIANSGFIPWTLALASFGLVLATKLPLAVLAGWLLFERDQVRRNQ